MELHLPVVQGKVSFPDLRIEYATQELEIARVDLELATGHYHAGRLSEKAHAGFQIYGRPEDYGSSVLHFAMFSNIWDWELVKLIEWHRERAGT